MLYRDIYGWSEEKGETSAAVGLCDNVPENVESSFFMEVLMLQRIMTLLTCCLLVVLASTISWSADDFKCDYLAQLSGNKIGPKPADTRANGEAYFTINHDGSALLYQLVVDDLTDVYMAHLHVGPRNGMGPIVVWLYPSDTDHPRKIHHAEAELASGVILEKKLRGPLAGMTLADLLSALNSGQAYVNVHTSKHITGELRGQIYSASAGY